MIFFSGFLNIFTKSCKNFPAENLSGSLPQPFEILFVSLPQPGPEDIILISCEHEILNTQKYKNIKKFGLF